MQANKGRVFVTEVFHLHQEAQIHSVLTVAVNGVAICSPIVHFDYCKSQIKNLYLFQHNGYQSTLHVCLSTSLILYLNSKVVLRYTV